jgi:hypothetical protein
MVLTCKFVGGCGVSAKHVSPNAVVNMNVKTSRQTMFFNKCKININASGMLKDRTAGNRI